MFEALTLINTSLARANFFGRGFCRHICKAKAVAANRATAFAFSFMPIIYLMGRFITKST